MDHKFRSGPIAVFLMVIAIILTMLVTLTLTTARADRVLAERFAAVTSLHYELEAQGQQFLKEYDAKVAAGTAAEADRVTEIEKNGYTLKIEVSEPDATGSFDVIQWELSKNWNTDDPFQNVWKGAE